MTDEIQKLLEAAKVDEYGSIVSAERDFADSKQAREAVVYYKNAILNLDVWNKNSVINSYALFDKNGREINNKPLAENLFLRIGMPGAGKYDWVKIARISSSPDEYLLTVKPTHDPTKRTAGSRETSHFFIPESSNNFCLQRHERRVKFYVIGLDERQNMSETKNTLESVRNAIVANAGYYLGVQKNEWTTFSKNFLDSYESA